MKIERDGTVLAYEEAGQGEPSMLLLHGWAMDRSSMRTLLDGAKSSRRVVSVDLRGFGESDAPDQHYTMEGYSDDLAFMVERLGLHRSIVVGHSMGGMIALDFASRHPALASAVVVLESMVVASQAVLAGLHDMLERVGSAESSDYIERLLTYLMGPHFEPADRMRLLALSRACQKNVLTSAIEAMIAFDSATAARRIECPLLYIGTDATYADLARFKELCPGLVTGKVVGCGHYFPVEAPEQVNPMIARFVRTAVAGNAAFTSRPVR